MEDVTPGIRLFLAVLKVFIYQNAVIHFHGHILRQKGPKGLNRAVLIPVNICVCVTPQSTVTHQQFKERHRIHEGIGGIVNQLIQAEVPGSAFGPIGFSFIDHQGKAAA